MKIAVIGTGTLGTEIAQVFSQCEKIEKVLMCKGRPSSRDGKDIIINELNNLVSKGKITKVQADCGIGKIQTGNTDLAAEADYLLEAVSEDLEIKRAVFRELDSLCDRHTVFATNTSSLPIQMISQGLSRPLVGMHFFNPAPVMKLVEVIATETTPQDIIDLTVNLAKDIGKTPVVVREAPGFVVNRVLIPMINEAISIYAEGVASVEDIDIAMKLGANHPMGPLALGDLIGLDVVLAILNTMLRETNDTRYLPQPLLKKMVWKRNLEGKLVKDSISILIIVSERGRKREKNPDYRRSRRQS